MTTSRPAAPAKRTRKRILTGDRPTGPLHVGNYVGTLANRVKLQDEYETFLLVADHHMLTTKLDGLAASRTTSATTFSIPVGRRRSREGHVHPAVARAPDPRAASVFLDARFGPRVQRIPTLKDQLRDHGLAEPTYGLLGYPVLQAADILIVKGDLVPVGKDQESHIELTREIARRFNQLFAPIFPEPQSLLQPLLQVPTAARRWERASTTPSI